MRVEGGTSNIINGVSRQPSEVRLTSQLETSINQFPTLTRGLVPRNPTLLRGVISSANPSNNITHIIDRDDDEQYVVTITPFEIKVYDLSGNEKTVNAPNGYGYLGTGTSKTLRALTVADHTFILNKDVTVAAHGTTSPAYLNGGLIHVVQGEFSESYGIGVNGTAVAWYHTPSSYADSYTSADQRQSMVKTRQIALTLLNGTYPNGYNSHNLNNNLPDQTWGKDFYDNVIHISHHGGNDFHLEAYGGEGRIRSHKGTVAHLADLPRKAPHGFGIKVTGSQESNYDDYYVKYDRPWGQGEGVWKETVAPSIPYKIDAATMPHILVREGDGSFTFKPASWGERECGDLETNPWPSFVGNKISGMIFFKNRMGFFSGESISMSRNGEFFNFFIESVLTTLDTDPVDVAISYPDVSDIYHAIPFGGEMILFTSSVPFRLTTNGELFTPKSVSLEPLLTIQASKQVKPVVGGDRLYFVNDKYSGAFVHEMIFDEGSGTAAAPTLTDHVQGYIPPNIRLMEVEDDLKLLCLVSSKEPNTLYIYKWLWVGQEKVQAAWGAWVIDTPILAMKFINEELILVTNRGITREILSLNCHEAYDMGKPFVPYLDRLVELTGAYDVSNDLTTFQLPYMAQGVMALDASQTGFGLEVEIDSMSGKTFTIKGNVTQPLLVGFPFESYCVLSKFHYRTTDNHGSYGNAVAGTQVTVANILLQTGTCAYLTATLERDYRKPYTYNFSAAKQGTKTAKVGEVVLGNIDVTLSIMARADDFRLKIGGKSPYPYSLLSYRWTGRATHAGY